MPNNMFEQHKQIQLVKTNAPLRQQNKHFNGAFVLKDLDLRREFFFNGFQMTPYRVDLKSITIAHKLVQMRAMT